VADARAECAAYGASDETEMKFLYPILFAAALTGMAGGVRVDG